MLERLEPRPLRLANAFGAALRSFEAQVQILLDARNAEGELAEACVHTVEQLLPLIKRPDGYLGELMTEAAELRGRDGLVALIGPASAFVGTMPELLAAARRTVVVTCEKMSGEGYAMDAAAERRAMEAGRPKLRAVS